MADFLGGSDNELFAGGPGAEFISGAGGDDTLNGGAGNDTITGGDGNDNLAGGGGNDLVSGDAGNDTLGAVIGVSTLDGGEGNDLLISVGNTGANIMHGGQGDDVLLALDPNGNTGNFAGSLFDGGDGTDTLGVGGAVYFKGDASSIENVVLLDPVASGPGARPAAVFEFDTGHDYFSVAPTFYGSGQVIVHVQPGDDVDASDVQFDPAANISIQFLGSTGNDTIIGTSRADSINGAAGSDILGGGDGNDNISGGGGNDLLNGDAGNDTMSALGGVSTLNGGDGNDVIFTIGNTGVSIMHGGQGDDVLIALDPTGNTGTFAGSLFDGGEGSDTLAIGGVVNFQGAINSIENVLLLPADPGGNGAAPRPAAVFEFNSSLDFEEGLKISGSGQLIVHVLTGDDVEASDVQFDPAANVSLQFLGSSGDETIIGTSRADSISGAAGNDVLGGGAGDDTLNGGAGNDTLTGGDGNDNLGGGSGNDSLSGGAGNDTLTAVGGVSTLDGGDGNDVLVSIGATGLNFVHGGQGDDVLIAINPTGNTGTFAGSLFDGGDGHDTLAIGGEVDFQGALSGVEGLLLLPADPANNRPAAILTTGSGRLDIGDAPVIGGSGLVRYTIAADDNDFDASGVVFAPGSSVLLEVHGSVNADRIVGSSIGDDIRGGGGADTIDAGGGADTVTASAALGQITQVMLGGGADRLVLDTTLAGSVTVTDFQAGAGGDALDLASFLAAKAVGLAPGADPFANGYLRLVQSGTDTVLEFDADGAGPGGYAALVRFNNVNPLDLTAANLGGFAPAVAGGSGGDAMVYAPTSFVAEGQPAPELDGGSGSDTLTITTPPPGDLVGPASVKVDPTDPTHLLFDLNGDGVTDLTVTNVEDIVLNGESVVISGNLAGTGLAPNTIVYHGTAGDNLLDASGLVSLESIRADGGAGNDTLISGNDDDTLLGGQGDDLLSSRGGPDSLDGGAGNDTLSGGAGADTLSGGAGIDTLDYSASLSSKGVKVNLNSGMTNFGDAEGDVISGFENVRGSAFNDALVGDKGANQLYGGGGDDVLTGGAGADTVSGGAGADTYVFGSAGDANGDVIWEFVRGADKIDLTAIDANVGLSKDQAFVVISGAFTHVAGQLRLVASGADTLIQGDVNGDAVADFNITVLGTTGLSGSDFLL